MPNSFITLETQSSPPTQVGTATVVMRSQALQLRLPFGRLVWNRPTSVSIRQPGADERTLPVVDVTRLAQAALLSIALAAWLLASASRKRTRNLSRMEVNE